MISITKVNQNDFQLLSNIGKTSFIESHGSSAATADINTYLKRFKKYLPYHLLR